MNLRINKNIQDGNTLDETIGRNEAALTEKGFPAENRTTLQNNISDLTTKEGIQNKREKMLEDLTAEQDSCISDTQTLIKKVRTAASSAYVNDARTLKIFNVGINKRVPKSVNGLRSECAYLSPVVAARIADLLKSGLQQADITALNEAPDKLINADKKQEDAKKQRSQATIERDDAAKELKKTKTKIRNFVKTAFAGNAAMLVQFEPISMGKGGGGSDDAGGDTPPENPPAK